MPKTSEPSVSDKAASARALASDLTQPVERELTEEEMAAAELVAACEAHFPTLALELAKLDLAAREHGHTLAEVLAKGARDAFGIDVR